MRYSNFARQSFLNISPEAKKHLIAWNKATKRWLKDDTTILKEGGNKIFHDHMHTFPAAVASRFPDRVDLNVPIPPTTLAGEARAFGVQQRLVNRPNLKSALNTKGRIPDNNNVPGLIQDLADKAAVDKFFEDPILNETYGGLLRIGQQSVQKKAQKYGRSPYIGKMRSVDPNYMLNNRFSYMDNLVNL